MFDMQSIDWVVLLVIVKSKATKQSSSFPGEASGLLRCARNDGLARGAFYPKLVDHP
jgi:hypothetical protein